MVVVLGGVKPRAHAAGVVDQKVVHEELPSDGDVNYCRGSGEICWVRHDAAVVLARRELRGVQIPLYDSVPPPLHVAAGATAKVAPMASSWMKRSI